jgi:hypothetical protein
METWKSRKPLKTMKKECVKKDPKIGAQSLTHFMNIKQRHPSFCLRFPIQHEKGRFNTYIAIF